MKDHKAWLLLLLLILLSGTFRRTFFNMVLVKHHGKDFTLLTHNIGSSLPQNIKPTWKFYKNASAEILCFQEWHNGSPIKSIQDSIGKYYHSTETSVPNPWPIFTKYPILNSGELRSKAKGNGCTWADIALPKDTIRVYNVHLASNRISEQTESIMNNPNLKSKNLWTKIKRIFYRYRSSARIRADQAEDILAHTSRSPFPFIVAGDFNDIPSSFVYRILASRMEDAFVQSANGMAYTYAGKLPFLHIDQILMSPHLLASNTYVSRVKYSDHFPVIADIFIKE